MAAAGSEAAGAGRAAPSWEPWVDQLLFSLGVVLDILTRVSSVLVIFCNLSVT
jgi:hypothetical protein